MIKNVCVFCGDLTQGGGTERMTVMLANAISSLSGDYYVQVLSKSGKGEETYFYLDRNIRYYVLDQEKYRGKVSLIKDIILLNSFLKKNKIDILIIVDVSLGVFTVPLHILRRKTSFVYWDHFSSEYINDNPRLASLRKLTSRICDAYITLTDEDASRIKGWTNKKVISIKNFCPYDERNNLKDNKKIIISIGNMIPVKGFDMAVEVAIIILSKYLDWEWHFYGDGSSLESLIQKAKESNVCDRIIFHGRVSDLEEAYKSASLLVMTSRSEGYGLVLTEAQAFHIPTVAFDVPYGPRNIIKDGIDGFLIEPFDIQMMINRISNLIEDQRLREKFSKALVGKIKGINQEVTINWIELLKSID